MIYRYSHSYYPAAPVMEVVFTSPAEGLHTERLSAVVDTGADGTLVPLQHLDDIRAQPVGREPARHAVPGRPADRRSHPAGYGSGG